MPETTPTVAMPADKQEETDDEALLVRRAQAGDGAAFALLCERHRRRIGRVVATVATGAADADDLAQEAIVRALRALPSFRGAAPFGAWICRIALHAAHDFQRSAWRRRVVLQSPDDSSAALALGEGSPCSPGPHEEATRRELRLRVRAAVAALGPRERTPIYLIYFEEFRLAEVARLEGVPESTIRSRVKVGLRRLGHSLGDLAEADADRADGVEDANKAEAATHAKSKAGTEWSACRT